MANGIGLGIGQRIPDLRLADPGGVVRSFYDAARGLPIVMTLLPRADAEGAAEHVATLDALARDGRAHCFVVVPGHAQLSPMLAAPGAFAGQVLLDDAHASAAQALRTAWSTPGDAVRTVVLDPNQRVIAVFDADARTAARRAGDCIAGLSLFAEPARPTDIAPALMIPRVLEPDYCRWLIEQFHARGHEEGGTYAFVEGRAVHTVDTSFKRRHDHHVHDRDLLDGLTQRVGGRIVPEVQKAFCYVITRAEEFKITCYRASEGGHFSAHRDNLSPQTAHRRFAVTINLNEEFEGGELCFPEYGRHLYRPRPGEAIVFSCSLLHEVRPVVSGDRYVLVAFMFGDDGIAQRDEIRRHLGAIHRA